MNTLRMERKYVRFFAALLLLYFLAAAALYWIAGNQMEAITRETSPLTPVGNDGGLVGTNVLEQRFTVHTDTLDEIQLYIGNFGRPSLSSFRLEILDGDSLLWQQDIWAEELVNLDMNRFPLSSPLQNVKDKTLLLRISTWEVPYETAITFYYGNTVSTGRAEVAVQIDDPLVINGQAINGALCLSLVGRDLIALKQLYWPAVLLLAMVLAIIYWRSLARYRQGKVGLFTTIMSLSRYTFLMKQLVGRDFKTKYKRSILGVLWSFLNPLLTMSVQYVIFSTLFKSSVPNFAVYLMCGGVIFNFFSESVGLGLTSIVGNAPLITKVYVPKYIYPVSRVFSSAVNVVISMIPLFGMIFLSGIPLRKSMLLIPLVLLYATVFNIGMSLLLSSSMVFFRDTQFLWGIVSMLWMYMTPIFYPESIIPQQFLRLYHMNPLYQFIYFLREITINGTAPGPYTFLYCTLCAVVPLLLGLWVFRKTQDRFVFYL